MCFWKRVESRNSEGMDWAPERRDHAVSIHSNIQGTYQAAVAFVE